MSVIKQVTHLHTYRALEGTATEPHAQDVGFHFHHSSISHPLWFMSLGTMNRLSLFSCPELYSVTNGYVIHSSWFTLPELGKTG